MSYKGTLLPAVIPKPKYYVEKPFGNILADFLKAVNQISEVVNVACIVIAAMNSVLYTIQKKRLPRKKKKALKLSMEKNVATAVKTSEKIAEVAFYTSMLNLEKKRTLRFIEL